MSWTETGRVNPCDVTVFAKSSHGGLLSLIQPLAIGSPARLTRSVRRASGLVVTHMYNQVNSPANAGRGNWRRSRLHIPSPPSTGEVLVPEAVDSASSIRRPREFHWRDKRVYCHEDRTHLGLARDALAGRPTAIRSNIASKTQSFPRPCGLNATRCFASISQENSCTILAVVLPWLRKEALEVESNPYALIPM